MLPILKEKGLGLLYCGRWNDTEQKKLGKTLDILEGQVKEKKMLVLPSNKGIRNIIFIEPKKSCPEIYPRKVGKPEKTPL